MALQDGQPLGAQLALQSQVAGAGERGGVQWACLENGGAAAVWTQPLANTHSEHLPSEQTERKLWDVRLMDYCTSIKVMFTEFLNDMWKCL